jgi:hypothetical protein
MERWARHVARMEKINEFKILVGKPEGKISVGRPRRRCEDNIKIDLGEIGLEGVDWIYLAHDRYLWGASVNTAMNLRVS